uniref:Legumain n=1 Tax=Phallusia mammillata TaxID=59560 RepID=A0A6F9DJ23_9ASCI|nr:legumain-like [Phallusia mammillata]
MKQFVLFVALFCVSVCSGNFVMQFEKFYEPKDNGFDGKIWVVLVAGSNGYYNYRHQADICHAYQVVHDHGISDEQIIVMMYDDIAHSSENPTPGKIINHPDGPDVYKGVPKDYTGETVTPENFLNVLTGNAQAMSGIGSGKVLGSKSTDHVFVYFSDHGAPGLIAFPTSELMKDDLNNAITKMHTSNMYLDLVFYIEACESGSMFDGSLSDNINVYATTAANPSESSYACYYDTLRQTYLGDRYSVSWLEDSDKENLETESLHSQFKIVKEETNQSHVMQYGDKTISKDKVGLFQGEKESLRSYTPLRPIYDDVPSPDVKIHILEKRIEAATSYAQKKALKLELSKEMEMRRRIEWTTNTIAHQVAENDAGLLYISLNAVPKLEADITCYRQAIQLFDSLCYELDDHEYAYRRLYIFGNLCNSGAPVNAILDAIRNTCK